jgi:phosphate transport system substrate-binding protein
MAHRTIVLLCWGVAAGLSVAGTCCAADPATETAFQLDPELPDYLPAEVVSGQITATGYDSMFNALNLWGEGFAAVHPDAAVVGVGRGSATAHGSLLSGRVTFGLASRVFREEVLTEFVDRFGHPPTFVAVAADMLAVVVHADNPIESLTLPQVDAIFSKTRQLGAPEEIATWGQLGLEGDWEQRPIALHGRNSASAAYGYFKEFAHGRGEFRDSVYEHPGSSRVCEAVAGDVRAIGYFGIGYVTEDVRAVPLAPAGGEQPVPAQAEFALRGEYPLARFLYLVVNHKPGKELDPLRREFLRYVLSKQGQEAVLKDGYLPITAEIARQQLEKVGLHGESGEYPDRR